MFFSGADDGDSECINIEILPDNVVEDEQFFQVAIVGTTPPGLNIDVTSVPAVVNITDTDGELDIITERVLVIDVTECW